MSFVEYFGCNNCILRAYIFILYS
uniref:Uncharacterized protein n=1 Tax=Anguilla anguilla TaxID=7936 RepID=A0A0E9QYN1_ANGAN